MCRRRSWLVLTSASGAAGFHAAVVKVELLSVGRPWADSAGITATTGQPAERVRLVRSQGYSSHAGSISSGSIASRWRGWAPITSAPCRSASVSTFWFDSGTM